MNVLMIDDEIGLCEAVKERLKQEGYHMEAMHEGMSGLYYAINNPFDLLILDLMLPEIDGLEILKKIRETGNIIPVILLSARTDLDDKIKGFDYGADDYLTKPFEMEELVARIRTITRRGKENVSKSICFSDMILDVNAMSLSSVTMEKSVNLGGKEYKIMEYLLKNTGQIITREQITVKVWGYDTEAEYNNVDVYISFIRKKMKYIETKVKIKSIRGVGYTLEA